MKTLINKAVMFAVIFSFAFAFTPALASHRSNDVDVRNRNSATVVNEVTVLASTGLNDANGGSGNDGGDSGNPIALLGSGATTGDGGDGGDGGTGGIITTGDATAGATVENTVNTNKTTVNLCGCGSSRGDVDVRNRNRANVGNGVGVLADTGLNVANGDEGGEGGDSGDPLAIDDSGASTGDGGDGGNGGGGGDVWTGSSTAGATVVNVINRNITRIRR